MLVSWTYGRQAVADIYNYTASPTGVAFHSAPMGYQFKGIRGVPGSGKSVTCCWDVRLKADDQIPLEVPDSLAVVDDYGRRHKMVRWSCWLIGRHTYKALEDTTLRTWLQWFPKTVWNKQSKRGLLEMPSIRNDGTWVRLELLFYSLDSPTIQNDLMSLELSGAFINEASQVPWDIVHLVGTRVGRFQPIKNSDVKLKSFGVIMDTNAPNENNWWAKFEEERPDGMLWFVQPPALLLRDMNGQGELSRARWEDNDGRDYERNGTFAAENIDHLENGFGYYRKMLTGASNDEIRRQIMNLFGVSNDGLPIYPEYNDEIHCHRGNDWRISRSAPIVIGMDFGCNPACVFCQMGRDGVFRVFDEATGFNMVVPQFVDEIMKPKLVNDFGWPNANVVLFGDPSGLNKSEMSLVSSIQHLQAMGINAYPSPDRSNNFDLRRTCVSEKLRSNYRGVPALQIHERCRMLRKGFNGWYAYRKIRTGSEDEQRYSEQADKNSAYSHVHDALQYACVGVKLGNVDMGGAVGIGPGAAGGLRYMAHGEDFDCL